MLSNRNSLKGRFLHLIKLLRGLYWCWITTRSCAELAVRDCFYFQTHCLTDSWGYRRWTLPGDSVVKPLMPVRQCCNVCMDRNLGLIFTVLLVTSCTWQIGASIAQPGHSQCCQNSQLASPSFMWLQMPYLCFHSPFCLDFLHRGAILF